MNRHTIGFREKLREWGYGDVGLYVNNGTLWVYGDEPLPPKIIDDAITLVAGGGSVPFDTVVEYDRTTGDVKYHVGEE